LQDGFRRAAAFAVSSALRKFALAIVDRPSLAGREDQLLAYSALARLEKDPDRALQYIEQGRSAARAAGHSCAAWDLMELTPRLHRREAEDLSRLVDHLRNRHLEEPGVAEALANFLVRVGALRPDGTPTGPSSVAPPSPTESPLPAAAEAAAPGQIWTPGSQQPGSTKKLWTPD
jgi:hypothetical protein